MEKGRSKYVSLCFRLAQICHETLKQVYEFKAIFSKRPNKYSFRFGEAKIMMEDYCRKGIAFVGFKSLCNCSALLRS